MDIHTNEIFENPDQAMDVVSSDEEEEKSSDKDVLMQQQQQQQQAEEEEDNDAPCRCLSFHSNNILSSNTSDRLIAISDDESVYSSSNLDKDNSHTFTHSRPAAQFLKSDQFPAEPWAYTVSITTLITHLFGYSSAAQSNTLEQVVIEPE